MIVNYIEEMLNLLEKINTKIKKKAKDKCIKLANSEIYQQNDLTASLMIESNCSEYISDLMSEFLSKQKFKIESIYTGEGQYDWDSDVYLKPYTVVTIKAY